MATLQLLLHIHCPYWKVNWNIKRTFISCWLDISINISSRHLLLLQFLILPIVGWSILAAVTRLHQHVDSIIIRTQTLRCELNLQVYWHVGDENIWPRRRPLGVLTSGYPCKQCKSQNSIWLNVQLADFYYRLALHFIGRSITENIFDLFLQCKNSNRCHHPGI